jgi:hypothetical protein
VRDELCAASEHAQRVIELELLRGHVCRDTGSGSGSGGRGRDRGVRESRRQASAVVRNSRKSGASNTRPSYVRARVSERASEHVRERGRECASTRTPSTECESCSDARKTRAEAGSASSRERFSAARPSLRFGKVSLSADAAAAEAEAARCTARQERVSAATRRAGERGACRRECAEQQVSERGAHDTREVQHRVEQRLERAQQLHVDSAA